jgi:ferredoxin
MTELAKVPLTEVPPDLVGVSRRALDACPTLALLLDEDGQ